MLKHNKMLKLFGILMISLLIGCSSNTSKVEEGKEDKSSLKSSSSNTISSLNIGDKVVDPNWSWEFRRGYGYTTYAESEETAPVVWIVIAKNHYMDNSVVLLAENLI